MKLNILSVDDSKAVLKYIEWVFSKVDHEVRTVSGGKQAIKFLQSPEGQGIDLILLDWEMPPPDGLEVLREFKKLGIKIPVAMLTSKNNESDIREALSLGVEEFIMKPFTPELLIEKIEEICS